MSVLSDLVLFVHSFISVFVMFVPFFADIQLVSLNLLFLLFTALHWILNNNICALTVLEKLIRRKYQDEETFFGSVFGKVYSLGNDSKIYWYVLIFLVFFSIQKIFTYIKNG